MPRQTVSSQLSISKAAGTHTPACNSTTKQSLNTILQTAAAVCPLVATPGSEGGHTRTQHTSHTTSTHKVMKSPNSTSSAEANSSNRASAGKS